MSWLCILGRCDGWRSGSVELCSSALESVLVVEQVCVVGGQLQGCCFLEGLSHFSFVGEE